MSNIQIFYPALNLEQIPLFAEEYLFSDCKELQTIRTLSELLKSQSPPFLENVPKYLRSKVRGSLNLLRNHLDECPTGSLVVNELIKCVEQGNVLKCTSSLLPNGQVDFVDTITIFEKSGELYIAGISQFHGGTNYIYRLSEISAAKCVSFHNAYDLFM